MRPTREGKRFLLAAFLIAVAALNTGNNLIYLILAMMLSILAVSLVALSLNMKRLSLEVSAPSPVFAGQAAPLEVTVSNSKRFMHSYSLSIGFPKGMEGKGHVPVVGAGSSAKAATYVTFKKRGVYSYGDFHLESGFPFIFLTSRTRVAVNGEVTVYPELRDMGVVERLSGGYGGTPTIRAGRGEDLLGIRQMREGDDTSLIDWKASAKTQELMVREVSEDEPRTATIILDDAAPFSPVAFERAVSMAASMAWELINGGFYVSFLSCAKRLPLGSGTEQLMKVLDALAVINERDHPACPGAGEISGVGILVVKSGASRLGGMYSSCDMVVDASKP